MSAPKKPQATRAREQPATAGQEAPKKRPGRPTTCTPEMIKRITAHVRAGAPLPSASVACGVPFDTAMEWVTRGRKGEKPYSDFLESLETARGGFATDSLNKIQSAGFTDWKASAWILERRDKRFQIRTREEVEREVTTIIGVLERELDANTLERILAAIVAAREPGAIPIPRLAAVDSESW